jgi:hypothetical protein
MSSKTRAWTAAYEGQPPGTEDRRLGDNRIRDEKADCRERLTEEHIYGPDAGGDFPTTRAGDATDIEGRHREGSARAFRITAAEADPDATPENNEVKFEANTSLGRLLVRESMTTDNENGLFVGDAAAGFDEVPISPTALSLSGVMGTFGVVRNIESYVSDNTYNVAPGPSAIPIDAANTAVTYVAKGVGNMLVVLHYGSFVYNNFGVVSFSGKYNTVVDESAAGEGSVRAYGTFNALTSAISFFSVFTTVASADVEIIAKHHLGGINAVTALANYRRRTLIIELGFND